MSEANPASKAAESPELSDAELEKKRIREEKKKAKAEAKKAAAAKKKASAAAAKGSDQGKKKEKKVHVKSAYVNTTPSGEKKDVSDEFPKEYDPSRVEAAWYDWWNKEGFFQPKDADAENGQFVMVIPPPNITGALHLGHALTNSIQDVVTRWHRMNGRRTLWLPGTDHAGIATQVRVEKKLMNEQGKTRHDLGREAFLDMVWQWKDEYGGHIQNQLRRLGSSFDWTREVFTLDDKLSTAVTEAFCRWFEEEKIRRDTRLVNWCCALNTAISDIEVDHVDFEKPGKRKVPGYGDKLIEFGVIHSFAYKVVGEDKEIIVSTTRIETMLGDTAVAVHPQDERYKEFHGKMLQHPFVDRQIPVILDDELVKMDFGTGAVKITPAHDPNDYLCGKKHDLPFITILNEAGEINELGGKFAGMKRFDARYAVIAALKELNLFHGKKPNAMVIGVCSRSGDIIEPMVKPQWFVDCKEMGRKACEAVRSGELEIIPEMHKKTWFNWLENIHDWCISRQLWWGHRIPAYLVSVKGEGAPDNTRTESYVCGRTLEQAMQRAVEKTGAAPEDIILTQDPDVLDTWFSSGLFPFSSMGWPNEDAEDLQKFYPTSLLETGHDILFFWVARMVMMGMDFTGKLPFKQVYLHAMVRDAQGRKMSKSKGNVIDPTWVIEGRTLAELHATLEGGVLDAAEIEIAKKGQKQNFPQGIGECGTDAMRFALCAYTEQGKDINLDISRVLSYRRFCNKMWNATKFVLMSIGSEFVPQPYSEMEHGTARHPIERWILSRLNSAIEGTGNGIRDYLFSRSTSACYNFFLNEFCGVIIEASKDFLSNGTEERQRSFRDTLYTCLEVGLRLLHPYMPYVTEELWQRIPRRPDETAASIMVCSFPQPFSSWTDSAIEEQFEEVQLAVQGLRSLKDQYGIALKTQVPAVIRCASDDICSIFDDFSGVIATLACCTQVKATTSTDTPAGHAVKVLSDRAVVLIGIKDHLDVDTEIAKLKAKQESITAELGKLQKKMASANFEKASEAAQAKVVETVARLEQELATTATTIADFTQFSNQ